MEPNQTNHNWYVVYTYPKAERKVERKLKEIRINSFLPLYKAVKQWSDRKKKLEVPLFPNYVFVSISPEKRYEVFQVNEIVKFVSFEGKPAIVPEAEINSLQKVMNGEFEIVNEHYRENTRVKIITGLFSGATGCVLRKDGKRKLVIQITALKRSVSVSLPADCVEEAIC